MARTVRPGALFGALFCAASLCAGRAWTGSVAGETPQARPTPGAQGGRPAPALSLPAQPKVMIIPVNDGESTRYGMIDPWQAAFVERRLREAKREHYDLVILEIDTNGGLVAACEKINKAIRQSGLPAVAFIRGKAFSGGAILSLGCDKIFMEPGTQVGGAQVVGLLGDLGKDEREKGRSMLAAMVKGLCERNGYPESLALGMVDRDIEIVETDNPKRRFFTDAELADWKKNAKTRGPLPNVVRTWKEKDQILTLTAAEAFQAGLSGGTVRNRAGIYAALGVKPASEYEAHITAAEKTGRFLGHPAWLVVLVLAALGGLFWEFKTPGLGLGILVFVFSMGLFFWLTFFSDTAGLAELLLFILGALLIGVELFVLPGFGVAGVLGVSLFLLSILLAFIPEGASLSTLWRKPGQVDPFEAQLVFAGLKWAAITLLAAIACVLIALFSGLRLPGMSRLALQTQLQGRFRRTEEPAAASASGTASGADQAGGIKKSAPPKPSPAPLPAAPRLELAALVGKEGEAETVLRPAGKVRLEGCSYDAVADREWLEDGTRVKVIGVRFNALLVRGA